MEYPKFDAPLAAAGPPAYTGPLPHVGGFYMIVRPRPPITQVGSIALPGRTKRANLATETRGQVLALGPAAFKAKTDGLDYSQFGCWPQVGDWIIYKQHAGQRVRLKGELERAKAAGGSSEDEVHLLIMADTDFLAKIPVEELDEYYSWVA